MSDYTPSMEEVREQYWEATGDPRRGSAAWGEFDRAVAEHDAKVRAEQRETDAQIAEADQFWDPRGEVLSSDEVSYNVARREAAAAIRAVPANTNTEEGN